MQHISTVVPEGKQRDETLKPIAVLNRLSERDNSKSTDFWYRAVDHNLTDGKFDDLRAAAWQQTGCDPYGAPAVVAALTERIYFEVQFASPNHRNISQWTKLATIFLDDKICARAQGISAQTRATLSGLAKPSVGVGAAP
jgi:hypothetical protein